MATFLLELPDDDRLVGDMEVVATAPDDEEAPEDPLMMEELAKEASPDLIDVIARNVFPEQGVCVTSSPQGWMFSNLSKNTTHEEIGYFF